jgi:hypothetical protein
MPVTHSSTSLAYCSQRRHTAVHEQQGAGDVGGIVGGQKQDCGGGEAQRLPRRANAVRWRFSAIWQALWGLALAPRPRESLDHLAVKGRDIIGLAAGDQITVDDGFLIDDIGSSIL